MLPSKRLAGAVTLALTLAAGPAVAGQFDYSLYAGVEHSDNINLSATAPVSQSVLVPGLGFGYVEQGATLQAHVTGGAEYRDYLGGAYANQKFGELAGVADWTILPERLDFVAQDYASVQPLSTLSSDAPGNQQQTNVLTLGPTLHFDLGRAVRGQAELHYIGSHASRATQFNSSRGEGALRLARDISPISELSLNLESEQVAFDEPSEIDYRRDRLFFRYAHKLAHMDMDVAAGWSHVRFDDGRTTSDPLVRASANWQATARNTLGVSYTRDYSDAAQELLAMADPVQGGVRPSAPASIQTGGAVIASAAYLERRVRGYYGFGGERLTASLSPWYRKLHYIEGVNPDQTGRGGDAGLNYRVRERLTLWAFANVERINYQVLARRDTTRNLGIGLRQAYNSHWSWRLSLVDRRRTSTAPGGRYHAKEAYFGIVYQR
ncbi:MAG TPA: hypothetical protein VGU65_12805 [Frateuria sp.]|uniref:hypothetical protein n=1 Tax=Frateuria sp. TaxID=2211372 RepID=UPI002DE37DB7|nr:hypothetical protein [Frateuria sp.]